MKKAKYEIKTASNGQYYFVLKAPNGRVIATSELYTSKQNAKNGIKSIKNNAGTDDVEEIKYELR